MALVLGDEGVAVMNIQKELNQLGASVSESGVYDEITVEAVKAFQTKEGLAPDGIVGPITFARIQVLVSQQISSPGVTYASKYQFCKINPAHTTELKNIAQKIMLNKPRYDDVAGFTGLPWYGIAAIHSMEAGLNFETYLDNGDPLFDKNGHPIKTTHVPAGVGPFDNWETAAVHAIGIVTGVKSIGDLLYWCEKYNGMGYAKRGVLSPYVWSYTNFYLKGKFVSDGVYDPSAVSDQPGVAAILKTLGV